MLTQQILLELYRQRQAVLLTLVTVFTNTCCEPSSSAKQANPSPECAKCGHESHNRTSLSSHIKGGNEATNDGTIQIL